MLPQALSQCNGKTMAYKQPITYAKPPTACHIGEKAALGDQRFDRLLLHTPEATSRGPNYRRSDVPGFRRDRGYWLRLLSIIILFITLKILVLESCLIPYLNRTSSSSSPAQPSDSDLMNSPSARPAASSSPLISRETVIDLTSGSVTGAYSLYDLLSIHTTSGHIDITLNLQNASISAPKPALLDLSTASGSVRVKTPTLHTTKIPDREYKTSIGSYSGSIDAETVHGTRTSLKTSSGRIVAELVPFGPNTSRSDIETRTYSGGTDITVRPSSANASQPLRKLYADYQHGSGGLRVRYPSTWEGLVQGKTAAGGVDIKWDGLRIVKDKKGYVGREIEAVKGEGEGVLRFHGYSGHVLLRGDSDAWVSKIAVREGEAEDIEPGVREGGLPVV